MDILPQKISPVTILRPKRFGDARGYFSELYSRKALEAQNLNFEFIQDNISLSMDRGVVRGLHFQTAPSEQTKLVSVLKGSVYDVAVDIRTGSPTYGQHVAATLSAENGLQMLVPRGFAHGFCTLEPDTLVMYKVDGYYDRERDFGLRWNDPALKIQWPVAAENAKVSDKDREQPLLTKLPRCFEYRGA
jgi:dTDP-4-dehydrorhamnose 3,5-epimerase